MNKYEELFDTFVIGKKLKFTKPRKIILNEVMKQVNHFDAESLFNLIQKKHSIVSKATVYRTLPILLEAGIIKPALRYNAKEYYEFIYNNQNHIHLSCNMCGKILEESVEDLKQILERAAAAKSFILEDYSIVLKGICADCVKNCENK